MALRIAPSAESELVEIWSYLVRESNAGTADRIVDAIVQRIFLLSKHPYLGRRRDDLRLGLRSPAAT